MQLKKHHRSIRSTLTAATAALVGAAPSGAASLNHSETSVLVYSERNRVHATEALFSLDKLLQNGHRFNLRLTYDGLTGASPTGGSPSKQAQTLTRPSGGSVTKVPAGALPIDNSFRETRFAVEASLSRALGTGLTGEGGARLSSEHDYKSIGLNGRIEKSLDASRTSIGLAASVSHDVNKPLGGVPSPLTATTTATDAQNGNRSKNVVDAIFSFTRVLNSQTVARFDYSFEYAGGYLTDPYKVVSVVQPADSADPGEPVYAMFENRPSKRVSNAASVALRKSLGGLITETSYRFFMDDWGVISHTVSLSMRADLNQKIWIKPSARWYHQGRADFSRPFLVQGAPVPQYVSSDARLAKFNAYTFGMDFSFPTSPNSRLTLSADYYAQRGDRSPPESFGPLMAFNLFPDLNAIMLRLSLNHDF